MEVTQQDVIHCARLAHISLSAEMLEALRQDMTKILSHAKNLDQLNLDLIEPYTHSMRTELHRRTDRTESDSLTKLEALANAPQTDGNCFIVPKIM